MKMAMQTSVSSEERVFSSLELSCKFHFSCHCLEGTLVAGLLYIYTFAVWSPWAKVFTENKSVLQTGGEEEFCWFVLNSVSLRDRERR